MPRKTDSFDIRPCSFEQHATCAARIITTFDWTDRAKCPPSCVTHAFHQAAIQYAVKLNSSADEQVTLVVNFAGKAYTL